MNENNMIFIVILVAAVILSLVMAMKNIRSRYHELDGEEKNPGQGKREPEKEDPAVTAAKKDLYHYLNQSIKKMYQYDRKNQWEKLTVLGVPVSSVREQYDKILASLPEHLRGLVEGYFACIDLEGRPAVEGETEAIAPGTVCDHEALRKIFLKMMLPFYPVYYKEVSELRHTSLLSRETLELFHCLTGKKYRLGYKNRYGTGVTAFRWNKDVYQVFDQEGQLLCDADFRDGKVWNGYAVLKADDYEEEQWELYRKGMWQEGKFVDGTLQYLYKKKCN